MASARQKKKNIKTNLIKMNEKRIKYLTELAVEDSSLNAEIAKAKRELKRKKATLAKLKQYSQELDHMVKSTSRDLAEKRIEAKRETFKKSWVATLSNEGKNQAIRILIRKGIVKHKSDYYEDFLVEHEQELTMEEIDAAIERHYQEALENEIAFANNVVSFEKPFSSYKRKYK